MRQYTLQEKYPVYHMELAFTETSKTSVDEIIDYYRKEIEKDDKATFIATFDHYEHTKNIGGEIDPAIMAAKNVVFCFGVKLPNAGVLAVRPRSIGIAQTKDRFEITFLEAPMPVANTAMETWTRALRDR
ncbi:DUF6858 family protein [Roseospira visakhapatnamensis]|uniref:Uncharacterized protein n=1 Tax=Roseospira visakhapatnamensis TaxID=390880 RepID=A0A7W6W960_9PROT|nr:hypothetical protein [Roseospira visakhapatnamensis]MBB4265131.1 hypothetical protein [Roseospira visakhapatnamensis]